MNWIRKHALAYQQEHGCTFRNSSSLRVYGNAEGAYGSNVNNLGGKQPLGRRGRDWPKPTSDAKVLPMAVPAVPCSKQHSCKPLLADVQLTYQNLDSVELGVTTVDNYFDTLGGITQAVKMAKGGKTPPVYIGDQTKGNASCAFFERTSVYRDAHAHAQPQMVRRHAGAWVRRCASN
jgi:magnesium chelatase subunit H